MKDRILMFWLGIAAGGLLVVTAAQAQTLSDTAKEKRWAEQVIEQLFDGEPAWLKTADHEFLAIEMASEEGDTGRAAIVVHGIGVHPNWDQIIRPLRVGLTGHGWHTLSVQMPILPNEAVSAEYAPLFDEVTDRFNAAISYLREKGQEEIVIVAHSMGSSMTMRFMNDVPDAPVKGLVLIGMQGGPESVNDNVAVLRRISLPILELYGSNDLPGVVDYAARKASAAHTGGNADYRQAMVDGADHFFDGHEEELVRIVSEWLAGLAAP